MISRVSFAALLAETDGAGLVIATNVPAREGDNGVIHGERAAALHFDQDRGIIAGLSRGCSGRHEVRSACASAGEWGGSEHHVLVCDVHGA